MKPPPARKLGVSSFVAVLSPEISGDGDLGRNFDLRLVAVEINLALQVIFAWLFLVLKESSFLSCIIIREISRG